MKIKSVTFHGEAKTETVGKDEWKLLETFKATALSEDGETFEIAVPAGFITDLASVPRLPGMYMLFGGRARRSAILHDYLYETQAGKDFADEVFYAAMRNEENVVTRFFMWAAVFFGGGYTYAKKRGIPSEGNEP